MEDLEHGLTDSISRVVPPQVARICADLVARGERAVTVGGAVRDALLGRPIGDWDVATSAHPSVVQATFRRTIPTGIQHGTVTVVIDGFPVEVTTFRGEFGYSDSRRPDRVEFGVTLEQDLSRRDFVINAIAFDPESNQLIDPYGGIRDLRQRIIRAVGRPEDRFVEDGLRIMRALRFAAVLGFDISPATRSAIASALASLERVAMERVQVELVKLLAAPSPMAALDIADDSGAWAAFASELGPIDRRLPIDTVGNVLLRVALLCESAGSHAADGWLRKLKFSNADRQYIVQVIAEGKPPVEGASEHELRMRMARIGRLNLPRVVERWALEDRADSVVASVRRIAERGDALAVGELALQGKDVMEILGVGPGRIIGKILRNLLDRVLEQPSLNTTGALSDIVRELAERQT